MVIGGPITEGIFSTLDGVPLRRTIEVVSAHFQWNYPTYFIVIVIGVWWLAHIRARFGGAQGYAIDPVCGMQVRVADAPACAMRDEHTYHFCSDRDKEKFEASPNRYTGDGSYAECIFVEVVFGCRLASTI